MKILLIIIMYTKASAPYRGTRVKIAVMRITEHRVLNLRETICKSRAESVPAITLSVYINGMAKESRLKK